MYQPLDTVAKQDMAELALTQVEGILRDLMEDDKQELVFTRYQMEREVETILSGGVSNEARSMVGRIRGRVEGVLRAAQDQERLAEPGQRRREADEAVLLPNQEEAGREIAGSRAATSARKRGGAGSAEDGIKLSKAIKKKAVKETQKPPCPDVHKTMNSPIGSRAGRGCAGFVYGRGLCTACVRVGEVKNFNGVKSMVGCVYGVYLFIKRIRRY